MGIELALQFGEFSILAQADLLLAMNQVLRIFRVIAVLLAVALLVFAGTNMARGSLDSALYALLGAGIMGGSTIIASALFEATDADLLINF